jgi:hypothetical protein
MFEVRVTLLMQIRFAVECARQQAPPSVLAQRLRNPGNLRRITQETSTVTPQTLDSR